MAARIRIVVAESGHDQGGTHGGSVIARALRDAGTEVVYAGSDQSAEQIVRTVIQEDADAVALGGADEASARRVRELLDDADANDVMVFAGEADDVVERVRADVATMEPADTG